MTVWLACADGFIAADVIRWREGIWERRGPKGGRSMKIGDRDVIAEVIDGPDEDGFVTLLVRDCVVLTDNLRTGQLKAGERMRRKAATIQRGEPARMRWSDEAARASIRGSRFLADAVLGAVAPGGES
jgi:hypothetical protein